MWIGLSDKGFLSSIEQFDKSSASWNVPLQRDWRIINHVLNSPRYEMAIASIPVHKVGVRMFYRVLDQFSSYQNDIAVDYVVICLELLRFLQFYRHVMRI